MQEEQDTMPAGSDLAIFRDELDELAPKRILDFRVELGGAAPSGPGEAGPADRYGVDELSRDLASLYPGRVCCAVCAPSNRCDTDADDNNGYVATVCDGGRFFPLRAVDPGREDRDEVCADLDRHRFFGLVPLLDARPDADSLLPDWLMEAADEAGVIVALDLPPEFALGRERGAEQLIALCEAYTRARLVLTGAGNPQSLRGYIDDLLRLRDAHNVFFDTAWITHWEFLEALFAVIDSYRLLFGSGLPRALTPGKRILVNNRMVEVTAELFRDAGRDIPPFTSFVYEELRAIRAAVERIGWARDTVLDFFHDNGMRLLKLVASGR